MTRYGKRLLIAALFLLACGSAFAGPAVPNPLARNLETLGGVIPPYALIPYLAQYENGVVQLGMYYSTVSTGNGTAAVNSLSAANFTIYATSGATALTTRTAAQMIADQPNTPVGSSYLLRVYNTNAGTLTLTGGTGVTISGTATIATVTWRDYMVTFNSATTLTMQNIGSGTQ